MNSLALTRVNVNLLEHHLSSPPLARGPSYLGLSIPLLSWLQPQPLMHGDAETQSRKALAPHLHPEDQRTRGPEDLQMESVKLNNAFYQLTGASR